MVEILTIYFQLDNKGILEEIKSLQAACIAKNINLKPHCDNVPVEKAHITLLAANVQEDQLEKAKKAPSDRGGGGSVRFGKLRNQWKTK